MAQAKGIMEEQAKAKKEAMELIAEKQAPAPAPTPAPTPKAAAEATKAKQPPVAVNRPAVPAPTMRVVSTDVTLQPGEMLIGTKDPGEPPVDLVLRAATGEFWTVPAQYIWLGDNMAYRHWLPNGQRNYLTSVPVGVSFKTGTTGRGYHFKPISPSLASTAAGPRTSPPE